MNRAEFRSLADRRLREAQVLHDNRLYSGAYYLAGYAVECALKACICKMTKRGDFPLDRKSLENVFTHDLEKLVKGAELVLARQSRSDVDQSFQSNWTIIKDWSEESRYRVYTQKDSRVLLNAINDPVSGIMQWLRNYW